MVIGYWSNLQRIFNHCIKLASESLNLADVLKLFVETILSSTVASMWCVWWTCVPLVPKVLFQTKWRKKTEEQSANPGSPRRRQLKWRLILLLHPFNSLFSRTTWVSRHQKGKPFWILLEQEMMGWWEGSGISWTICRSSAPRFRQITMSVPHHSVFTDRMPFLRSNQQCQSTEGLNGD